MHVFVIRPKVSPLEAIHRAQISFLPWSEAAVVQKFPGSVGVPDSHPLLWQFFSICGTLKSDRRWLVVIKQMYMMNWMKAHVHNTLINQSSSSRMPFQKTLLVVSRGNWSMKTNKLQSFYFYYTIKEKLILEHKRWCQMCVAHNKWDTFTKWHF